MSSSDSDSSTSSSDCDIPWPKQCFCNCIHESDESDSSSEDLSDESSDEDSLNDSWTDRQSIFISVYNTNNHNNITLITNYNELHNYREKYKKLSKKNSKNIKNIWNEVKVNVHQLGIIPLKSYEKEIIENQTNKNKNVKKRTIISKQNGSIINKSQSVQNTAKIPVDPNSNKITVEVFKVPNALQSSANRNKEKQNNTSKDHENLANQKIVKASTNVIQASEGKKVILGTDYIKVDKQNKSTKVDTATKIQSTKSTLQLNVIHNNIKTNSNEQQLKKSQIKTNGTNNSNNKNKAKDDIFEPNLKKQKRKHSNSQCSESSDIKKRSTSVNSQKISKVKSKKKIESSDHDTTDSDDEDEEIVDNMDALTGISKVYNQQMTEILKYKKKTKAVETIKVADKKIHEKNNNGQNAVVEPVNTDFSLSTSANDSVLNSEIFAEESVDKIIENNLVEGLETLNKALRSNPVDDRHYLNRCYCYLRMNKPDLALADAQYILQSSSHSGHRFIACVRAGKALMALQKHPQAENYLKYSLSINFDNVYAQREYMRAKILRIVSLGYTERSAVLALLKYSKTEEAINYLVDNTVANKENKSDNYDDIEDLNDLVYSSEEDENPNNTTLINNILNYKPIGTKLCHLLAKPVNLTTSMTIPSSKNVNNDYKKINTNAQASTGQLIDKAIWVGSLKKDITEAVLRKKFQQFGNIVSVYCPPNEAYAFINFEKSEYAANVLKNSSAHEINGVKLLVRPGIQRK